MAIMGSELRFFRSDNGAELIDGQMNNLFGDAVPGSGQQTQWVVFQNTNNNNLFSWSAGRVWFAYDFGGASLQMGLADGTARAATFVYTSFPTPTYSSPVDFASGLVIPTLQAGQKVLLAIRRDTAGATVAQPEVNRLVCLGTSPI